MELSGDRPKLLLTLPPRAGQRVTQNLAVVIAREGGCTSHRREERRHGAASPNMDRHRANLLFLVGLVSPKNGSGGFGHKLPIFAAPSLNLIITWWGTTAYDACKYKAKRSLAWFKPVVKPVSHTGDTCVSLAFTP